MDNKLKTGISQEGLKLLACITMLIDHIGAIFFPTVAVYRIIGRIAFPIYAFLLAEGVFHTRNPMKYGLRLLLVAVLTELPYDLLFRGEFTWAKNSAMITLLLGFGAGIAIKHCRGWWKLLVCLPFIFLARYAHSSYGMEGVLMIVLFLLCREVPCRRPVQIVLMVLLSLRMAGFPGKISLQIYGLLALIPITLYSGEKRSRSKAMQWAFTLFYPVHIIILLLIRGI